ncbi:MAG: hypothetical protein KDB14_10665 [Planctomycetales bacterium]|nr:hypothetical protein [Planctomycetales bacterium]
MPSVTVQAGCRLHFGLFSFGGEGRQFGGVGAMLDSPQVDLRISASSHFECKGVHATRVESFRNRFFSHHASLPTPCLIEVLEAPPEHQGLGLGTALGMSVAAGLRAWLGMSPGNAGELAASVGRGLRSAVGAHGFLLGGMIAEQGRAAGEDQLSPLTHHLLPPSQWRFVLISPPSVPGLSGLQEQAAFDSLPAIGPARRQQLVTLAEQRLLPAAAAGDFAEFAESLHQFGKLAGECFAPIQGGPFNGPLVSGLVRWLRARGVLGVGQSSWGPTVYALVEDEAAAKALVERVQAECLPEFEPLVAAGTRVGISAIRANAASVNVDSGNRSVVDESG